MPSMKLLTVFVDVKVGMMISIRRFIAQPISVALSATRTVELLPTVVKCDAHLPCETR